MCTVWMSRTLSLNHQSSWVLVLQNTQQAKAASLYCMMGVYFDILLVWSDREGDATDPFCRLIPDLYDLGGRVLLIMFCLGCGLAYLEFGFSH